MWTELKAQLAGEIARAIRESFGVDHQPVVPPVLEVPPRRELGDLASPAAMQLARTLKRNPRAIAEELAAAVRRPAVVKDIKIQGAGYLNFYLDRPVLAAQLLEAPLLQSLPAEDRLLLKLHYWDGLSMAAISPLLGRPQRELYSVRDKCLKKIRRNLEEAGLSPERIRALLGCSHLELAPGDS